jgi:imidazolonepropionase
VLARLEMRMTLPEVIAGLTVGAAFALNRAADVGSLTPGKYADFSVLKCGWREFFLAVGNHPIKQVYLSGEKSAFPA